MNVENQAGKYVNLSALYCTFSVSPAGRLRLAREVHYGLPHACLMSLEWCHMSPVNRARAAGHIINRSIIEWSFAINHPVPRGAFTSSILFHWTGHGYDTFISILPHVFLKYEWRVWQRAEARAVAKRRARISAEEDQRRYTTLCSHSSLPKPYPLHHKKSITQARDLTHTSEGPSIVISQSLLGERLVSSVSITAKAPPGTPARGWKNNEKPLWETEQVSEREKERGIVWCLHAQLVRVAILNSIHSDGGRCVGKASDAFPCRTHNRCIETAALRDICAPGARLHAHANTVLLLCARYDAEV